MDELEVADSNIPLVANAARIINSASEVKVLLPEQLRLPVKLGQSIELLRELGVTEFMEFGYGDVLGGMVKRQLGKHNFIIRHAKDSI
jgi:malonyl CoA-acyl carrier protein transacylase